MSSAVFGVRFHRMLSHRSSLTLFLGKTNVPLRPTEAPMNKVLLAVAAAGLIATVSFSQDAGDKAIISKTSSQTYAPAPRAPACVPLAILHGDPDKGPSVVEIKLT